MNALYVMCITFNGSVIVHIVGLIGCIYLSLSLSSMCPEWETQVMSHKFY